MLLVRTNNRCVHGKQVAYERLRLQQVISVSVCWWWWMLIWSLNSETLFLYKFHNRRRLSGNRKQNQPWPHVISTWHDLTWHDMTWHFLFISGLQNTMNSAGEGTNRMGVKAFQRRWSHATSNTLSLIVMRWEFSPWLKFPVTWWEYSPIKRHDLLL